MKLKIFVYVPLIEFHEFAIGGPVDLQIILVANDFNFLAMHYCIDQPSQISTLKHRETKVMFVFLFVCLFVFRADAMTHLVPDWARLNINCCLFYLWMDIFSPVMFKACQIKIIEKTSATTHLGLAIVMPQISLMLGRSVD